MSKSKHSEREVIPYIAEFEELVMLAILKLGGDAYGASIYEALEEIGRSTAIGALYTTLGRLEGKGLISSRVGEPNASRGGRAKKFYKVEGNGIVALRERDQSRKRLVPTLAFSLGD